MKACPTGGQQVRQQVCLQRGTQNYSNTIDVSISQVLLKQKYLHVNIEINGLNRGGGAEFYRANSQVLAIMSKRVFFLKLWCQQPSFGSIGMFECLQVLMGFYGGYGRAYEIRYGFSSKCHRCDSGTRGKASWQSCLGYYPLAHPRLLSRHGD